MTAAGRVPHILVTGNATIDDNFVGGVSTGPRLGGSGAIISLALSRFGNRVTWLGHVGPDGEGLLEPLEEAGVERLALRCDATLRFENRYPDPAHPAHRVQRARRIPPSFTLAEIEAAVRTRAFDFLVLGPLTPTEIPVAVLDAVRGFGLPAAIDLQGYVRRVEPDGRVLPSPWPRGLPFPTGFRVVHADEAEARLILEGFRGSPLAADAAPAGSLLAALHRVLGADLVCITRGENGAVLCPESDVCGDALRVAAFRPAPAAAAGAVGDTTGCGDIFLAGLVHGELCAWPRERSGRFAAAAAGWNAASLDLRVPTGAEVEELLSQGGH